MIDIPDHMAGRRGRLILGIVLLLLVAGGATAVETFYTSTYTFTYNASATVDADTVANRTEVGVNPDPELHFGEVPRNANITKFIEVSARERSLVTLSIEGNISRLVRTEGAKFFEGNRRIALEVYPRDGIETGYYSGTVTVTVQASKGTVGTRWLALKSRFS
ncbi:MAG: hypothetical protein ABEK12_00645 [Candidatus Nanohaloarchaea archaeon]